MPFDGLTIRAVTRQLNQELGDARIDKIHHPERDELIFSLRSPRIGSARLVLSANPRWARMHISTEKKANPSQPSAFCMLLRKYLEGAKIKGIEQIGMERVVYIRLEALNDFREWQEKLLVCEFMGRHSNIILVNPENNLIIDAIKKVGSEVSSFREILTGREYVPPPGQGKLDPQQAGSQEFAAAMWAQPDHTDMATALFNVFTGVSPYTARHICRLAGFDDTQPVDECGALELDRLYATTRDLIHHLDEGDMEPCVKYRKNLAQEFSPFQPAALPRGSQVKKFASMNAACDHFFTQKLGQLRLESMQNNLVRTINEHLHKAYRKQFLQEGDLQEARENEKYKLWGEMLTAYAHRFRKGDTEATMPYFTTGEEIKLPLDPRYTPIQNAQRYFRIYNKSRGALRHLKRLMAENQANIDYLESVLVAVKQAQEPLHIEEVVDELEKEHYLKPRASRPKAKKASLKPRRFMSSDGLLISVGRNNLQNDRLTLRDSNRNDLWLHAKEIPGTHVIITLPPDITSIDAVPDTTLEEAAALAAHFSKASGSRKVAVDYTFRHNVKKPGSAKPGMVVYDNYWTILVDPASRRVQELLDSELAADQVL
ncbi:MAG: fibronectin/fibrinogen-binding protein [Syntrophomonadaceae bacterium]|nr:fibronectin/fibrinogen-binding protein [Syntrophomonadaceae bacterium]